MEILARQTIVTGGGHFPVLIRRPNGDLLAVVRGKYAHVLGDGSLDLLRSTDNGATWSAPQTVVDAPGEDDRNPALGQLADGTLVLAYMRYDLAPGRSRGVWVVRSRDAGRTWDEPTGVYDVPPDGGGSPYGKVVQLPDGTALLSLYCADDLRLRPAVHDGVERAWLLRSTDGGRTWREPSVIAEGFNEAGLAVLRDGRLLAALRKSPGPDCDSLSLASSTDGGYTWSPPQPVTAPGEHPGDLVPLRNGSILLTYGVRHDPGQPFTGYDRNRQVVHQMGVAARMSEDGGRTWSPPMALAQDAPNYDCGYPSSVELEEGRILTLYYRVKGEADYDLAGAETRLVLWRIGSGRPVIQESAAD